MSSTMNKTTLFAAVLAMASTTSAHMFLASPVPFSGVSKNPLSETGSDFPCQASSYQITTMNEWAVGSDVTVSFPPDQTATHGGGSCQVSVTKDQKPTKDSVWKVIHSIEGGCPTTYAGNINDPKDLGSFGFKVPSELPEGQLTMAWTWFNKVGNREMYMNCAPINVSGGTGEGFDSLPDMAVANIGGGSCTTSESSDYTFKNPGKSVAKLGTGPFKELCGGAASEGGSTGGSGNTGGSGGSGGSGSAPVLSTPAAPSTQAPKEPTAPQAPSSGGSTGGATGGGSSCSENGALLCNGESQFGLCSNGVVVYQSVAAGTKCSGGQISRRELHRNARSAIPPY